MGGNIHLLIALALLLSTCGAPFCHAASGAHFCCASSPQQGTGAGVHIAPSNGECACASAQPPVVIQAYQQAGKTDLFAAGLAAADGAEGYAGTTGFYTTAMAFFPQTAPTRSTTHTVLRI